MMCTFFWWGVHSTRRFIWLGDAIVKISGFLASGSLTYLSNMEKKKRYVHPQVLVDKSSFIYKSTKSTRMNWVHSYLRFSFEAIPLHPGWVSPGVSPQVLGLVCHWLACLWALTLQLSDDQRPAFGRRFFFRKRPDGRSRSCLSCLLFHVFFGDVPRGFNMFQSDVLYVLFSCQSLPMMIHQQKLEKQMPFWREMHISSPFQLN